MLQQNQKIMLISNIICHCANIMEFTDMIKIQIIIYSNLHSNYSVQFALYNHVKYVYKSDNDSDSDDDNIVGFDSFNPDRQMKQKVH